MLRTSKINFFRNYTRFGGLQPVNYDQDATYIQNTKIDADIVIIEAVEILTFRSPFDAKWGFSVESRTHVEIRNRTMHYVKKYCNADNQTVSQCAAQTFGAVSVGKKRYNKVVLGRSNKENKCAAQTFGAVSVGKKRYNKVVLGRPNKENKFAKLVEEYRNHLYDMGETHTCEKHSSMFAHIVQEARHASEQDWKTVIMHPENEP
ncbi:unnamed protein product, partial [Cylicostephanus goldi]